MVQGRGWRAGCTGARNSFLASLRPNTPFAFGLGRAAVRPSEKGQQAITLGKMKVYADSIGHIWLFFRLARSSMSQRETHHRKLQEHASAGPCAREPAQLTAQPESDDCERLLLVPRQVCHQSSPNRKRPQLPGADPGCGMPRNTVGHRVGGRARTGRAFIGAPALLGAPESRSGFGFATAAEAAVAAVVPAALRGAGREVLSPGQPCKADDGSSARKTPQC